MAEEYLEQLKNYITDEKVELLSVKDALNNVILSSYFPDRIKNIKNLKFYNPQEFKWISSYYSDNYHVIKDEYDLLYMYNPISKTIFPLYEEIKISDDNCVNLIKEFCIDNIEIKYHKQIKYKCIDEKELKDINIVSNCEFHIGHAENKDKEDDYYYVNQIRDNVNFRDILADDPELMEYLKRCCKITKMIDTKISKILEKDYEVINHTEKSTK